MSFIAPESAPSQPDLIKNTAFWPDLDMAHFRDAMRTDGTVTPPRLRQAVLTAISEVNAELFEWRQRQLTAGHTTLAEVPGEQLDGEPERLHLYRRAVWCWARANLAERYRDYDATAAGNKRADALEPAIDDLWRDVRWALSRLQSQPHVIVELI
ncbi:head completion/stabilization protein [Dickeya dianthicola]|uniref:head completion/stabilization protein n=1 Tax=Dickeya dianthicola TaxID=204039 RepID=UPI001F61C1BF|nr:head completion/stabilization protein [Dickeya dianthicola]MCI4223074.1 head completion/stabilization protein [Dickeya dianthicola]